MNNNTADCQLAMNTLNFDEIRIICRFICLVGPFLLQVAVLDSVQFLLLLLLFCL